MREIYSRIRQLQEDQKHAVKVPKHILEWMPPSNGYQEAIFYEVEPAASDVLLVRSSMHVAVHHDMRLAEATSAWRHGRGFEFSYLTFAEPPSLAIYLGLNRQLLDHLTRARAEGVMHVN